jgi:TolB-like protein/DNA-binding SARP family transcriptional activator
MAPRLHLRLLGAVTVERDGGDAEPVAGKKLQALIAYLVVEHREHSREQLAALLWGDMDDERARHNLRQALSKLRRVFDDALVVQGDRVSFDHDVCSCDVRELHRAISAGELDLAFGLMERELLEGLSTREDPFDGWLRKTRDRLRNEMCSALDSHLDDVLADGQSLVAEPLLQRRLELDPTCEQAHRALMKIAWHSGRRVDAIRQYEICEHVLRSELGVEVSAETQILFESIRSGAAPGRDAPPVPAVAPPKQRPDPPSVAVMAFENLADETDGYFADGISEDIITGLSRFGSLLVIARQSTFRLRDRELSISEIGECLGATYVVQGSVRRAKQRVRINVQLSDAVSEHLVWGQRFDLDLEDVFVAEDELIATVVSTLAGRVEAARAADVRRMPAERMDAYDRVLRGKFHHHMKTVEDCELAIGYFEQAIDRDANYALGHAWLACGLGQALGFRLADRNELLDRAHEAAERGRRLDDSESECHRILGQVSLLKHQLPQAVHHSQRAVELNPNDDRCLAGLGEVLSFVGRSEEGVSWVRRAIRLNPFHPQRYWSHLARGLFHEGHFSDAVATLAKVTSPRITERAYAVAAAVRSSDAAELDRTRSVLRERAPTFDVKRFVDGLPYDHPPSRDALVAALTDANV